MAANTFEMAENASQTIDKSMPIFVWFAAREAAVSEVESLTDGGTAAEIDDRMEITLGAEHATEYEKPVTPEVQRILDSAQAAPRGLSRWIKSSRDMLKEAPTTLVLSAIDRLSQPKPQPEALAPEKKTGRRRAQQIDG